MKTTLDLNDTILRAAKKRAAERGTTLTAVIEEALRTALSSAERTRTPVRLPVWKDPEELPFDVADRRAMYEWFDQRS